MEESVLIPKIELSNNLQEVPVQSKLKVSKKTTPIVVGVLSFLILAIFIPGFLTYQSSRKLLTSSLKLGNLIQTGNLPAVKAEIPNVKKSLSKVRANYVFFSWTKILPFVGGYVGDLGHVIMAADAGFDALDIMATTIQPYAETLGFTQALDGEKTTQERIDFIIKAIPDVIPKLDEISGKLSLIKKEIDQIDPARYPEKMKGKVVRANIIQVQVLVDQGTTFVTEGKPLLEVAPYLLGIDGNRNYLVLFQNDKELRPTGGFMTAYSIMKVSNAKFEPVLSNDIYNLDAKYKPNIMAPDPLITYIKGPYVLSKNWRLRDMNWSPDFEESMKLFTKEAQGVGVEEFDGIIGVDTQLLVNLLDAMGPIGVPGFGNFSTKIEPKCNCPQVIYELESFADTEGPIVWDPVSGKIVYTPPNYDNRKKIIGPLMNSILANALGQPREKLPSLFEAGYKSLIEKHVLLYLIDAKAQKAVSDFGIGGRIEDYQGDYLHVNDANLGGRKSNLYVKSEVSQEIEIENGEVVKTVTLTYKNPMKHDGWLNSVLPNWVRVYVPKGSELIAVEGLEDKIESYEDLGKTVFAGLFSLRPEGISKITFKYRLPFKVSKDYKMLIQKQPGTDAPLYMISLGKHSQEFNLRTDKEIKLRI